MPGSAAPPAPVADLRVCGEGRVVPAGAEFSFDVVLTSAPAEALDRPSLSFPGFVPAGPPAGRLAGGFTARGRIDRPGFYPLAVTAEHNGARLGGRDYFVVPEARPVPTVHEAGYYVFLGCGDYPIITGRETHALAAWTLEQWQNLVSWMGANGMNRLWVLLNGYTLAYPSRRYPGLCDRHARNVRDNFLGKLIDHAHAQGVKVYLMLTTDGHAREFSRAHPEAARLGEGGRPCPQFGLALEHPLARKYIFEVLDEVLEFYPEADGIAVHPTESDPDRFNPESLAAYRAETGRDLRAEPKAERRAWHNRAFARFMVEFCARARRRNPRLDLVMANSLWQDDFTAINRAELPGDLRIAVWHYAWEDETAKPWPIYRWVEAFGPGRILYLPTSQSYLYPSGPERVMDRHIGTDRLVSTAAALGVRDTIYFAGWDILPEEARLCDAQIVRRPTAALQSAGAGALELIPRLYADYFAVRAELL